MFHHKKIAGILLSVSFVLISFSTSLTAEVVWSDDFDSETIDMDKWTFDVGTGDWGWGNGELENYTARSENVYIEDGKLVIQAKRENYNGNAFTSARLKTKGRMAFTYGTLEARIKIPDLANGLWPAFWLLGDNISSQGWPKCGEIDILEMGMAEAISAGTQNRRHSSGAFWDYEGNQANYAEAKDAAVDLNNDFHNYKLVWTPQALTTYVDNQQAWRITIDNPDNSLEEFHKPMHILLNLAVGGKNFVDIIDPGAITATFPAKMYIDWIRLCDDGETQLFTENTIEQGNFGVFTETAQIDNQVTYGDNANLYIWNNLNAVEGTPFEGDEVWAFESPDAQWWGMGVSCSIDRNMKRYSDGYLHLHMKTSSSQNFRIGISSSAAGEGWLTFVDGGEQFGLIRDGSWHEVLIPLNRFGNVDFPTINQLFMIAGDGVGFDIAIDNVFWSESVPRPTPANGSFGIFTESAEHQNGGHLELGSDGNFYIWENTLVQAAGSAYEGEGVLALQSAPGVNWFGAAFTANIKHNLTAFRYSDSFLHFAMKTSSNATFQIGMKSGNVNDIGQKWITFQTGSDPYGFTRDGNWHEINIPMTDIMGDVNLAEVSQVFEILGTSGPIGAFAIDDICFLGGGEPVLDNTSGNRPPSVSVINPSTNTVFQPGSNISVNVIASDLDGSIAKVDFYVDDDLVGTDTTEPYEYLWDNAQEGSYSIKAVAEDDAGAATVSSSVKVHVGVSKLTELKLAPSSAEVSVGDTLQYSASSYDQFGLPFDSNIVWSVSGGGCIDDNGLFTAVYPGGPFNISAQVDSIIKTVSINVVKPSSVCTGGPENGEYTYEVSGDFENPSITFIPGYEGVGSGTVILYYSTNPDGVFPGVFVTPDKPFIVSGSEGQTLYFYYTYSVPEGGQHNTANERHSVVVGTCGGSVGGDITGDGFVDINDLTMLAFYWLEMDCNAENDYCFGADIQEDSVVNIIDLSSVASTWLE